MAMVIMTAKVIIRQYDWQVDSKLDFESNLASLFFYAFLAYRWKFRLRRIFVPVYI